MITISTLTAQKDEEFMHYTMNIAGLSRDLPLCKVTDELFIAAFIMLGDQKLTVACAKELLKKAPEYDYLLTAEAKSIPLIHEMARQHGDKQYLVARKGTKVYMETPLQVPVRSITTDRQQYLYLSKQEADAMKGKRILIIDDVISTGESLIALETLVKAANGKIVGKMAVLAEGDAANREDITFLSPLPLFNANGSEKE